MDTRRLVVALMALLVGVGVTVEVVDDDGAGPGKPRLSVRIIKTTVDGVAEKPGVQPVVIAAPAPVVEQATEGIHTELGQGDAPELAFPQAAPSQRGCLTRTVRNMSSRGGVRPRVIVLHYTVGPNRVGLSDMDATTTLANSPAAAVSWHFLIDREGNCYFSVPLTMKAWTQANANPFSVGIEIVNSGREPNLIDGAGLRKLGLVVSDTARRLEIPLQEGEVTNCQPVTAGVVDHKSLGLCGGGHVDVTPYPSAGASLSARVWAALGAARAQRSRDAVASSSRTCGRVHAYRVRRRAGRPGTTDGRLAQKGRLWRLEQRGVRCLVGRPVAR